MYIHSLYVHVHVHVHVHTYAQLHTVTVCTVIMYMILSGKTPEAMEKWKMRVASCTCTKCTSTCTKCTCTCKCIVQTTSKCTLYIHVCT